jgi:hypothetical protein
MKIIHTLLGNFLQMTNKLGLKCENAVQKSFVEFDRVHNIIPFPQVQSFRVILRHFGIFIFKGGDIFSTSC